MAKLTIDETGYFVDGQKLESGMIIRRYDEIAGGWFEGEVGLVYGYDHKKQQRFPVLSLVVEGYVPSPLQKGDIIEIVSKECSEI